MEQDNSRSNTVDTQVNKIGLRIPTFWKANVKLRIIQIEASFKVSGITVDETKYDTIAAALDPDTLSHVKDLITQASGTDRYEILKERLISEFADSESKRLRILLKDLMLGDQKPSHLLRKMRELASDKIKEDFLEGIWLSRLPTNMQSILSVSAENLTQQANLADKLVMSLSHLIALKFPKSVKQQSRKSISYQASTKYANSN